MNLPNWLLRLVDKSAHDSASDRSHWIRSAILEKLKRETDALQKEKLPDRDA